MRGVSTAFWSIVLIGSTASIAAGFVGGRSIGSAGALPVAEAQHEDDGLPAPIRQRLLRRSLFGAHSLDAAGTFDPYGDPELAVTDRTRSAAGYDSRTDRAKIAVVVVDAGGAGPGLDAFVNSPLPLTLAVAPTDDDAASIVQKIDAAGKTAVVDGSQASPAQVTALLDAGARGVIASLDRQRATRLLDHIDRNALVVDAALAEDDDVSAAARALHRRVYPRDVIADARDDGAYIDFMLRDALAIAQRTGTAVVAVHARTQSFDAIARFADRAQRDGADIVALTDLDR
ncbi:MAG: divergent polysaccharide deacetylase family protein [Candidatus Lustribacter sp.]